MKAISLLLFLTFSRVASGQVADSAAIPVITTAGAFFALSVADIAASARWYKDIFGLTVLMQAPTTDKAAVTVLEGGGLIVELIQHDDAVPLAQAAPAVRGSLFVHGLFKVGLIVDDFDGTLALLRSRGVEIVAGPFPRQSNQRANVLIKDNAGNLIQLFGQ